MDVPGMVAGASLLSRPAEEFENDVAVEAMWAKKAFEYAEIHFNIICSVDPKYLKLTDLDDELYKSFRYDFPDMNINAVREDELKCQMSKQKWRKLYERFNGHIEDITFGTLLRKRADGEYSEENTILTNRLQFYAVEIARNREGCNDFVKKKYQPVKI